MERTAKYILGIGGDLIALYSFCSFSCRKRTSQRIERIVDEIRKKTGRQQDFWDIDCDGSITSKKEIEKVEAEARRLGIPTD